MRMTSGVPFGASARTYAPLAAFVGRGEHVAGCLAVAAREHGDVLAGERESGGAGVAAEQLEPHDRRLVGVRGAHDGEVRDGAQRRELLDRLVGGAVLAEGDGVVRPHVDRRDVHQRRDAHRRAHVVAEDQERAAEGAGRAVQHDAVDDRAHRVLADAEVQHAAVAVARPFVGRPLGRDERLRRLDGGEVRLREVGRAAPQLGELRGEGVDHGAGCGAGRDLLAGLEAGQRRRRCPRAARAPGGGRTAPCAPGSPRPTRRTRSCHAARSVGAAVVQACGCARARPRARRRSSPGSQPSTFLVAASSSPPRAEPWILPVFCLPGEGQPMIVFSTMIEGLDGLGLGRLDRGVELGDVFDVLAGLLPVDGLHVPAIRLVARRDVLGEGDVGVVLDRDLVGVVDRRRGCRAPGGRRARMPRR